jgi:hypothetical protein
MTRPDRDYDDILSRVLHSTLDPIEPAGDGLAKIQKRIAEPWLKRRVSLLRTELTALGWLIAVRCEPFLSAVRSSLAGVMRQSGRRMRSAPLALGGATAAAGSRRHHDRRVAARGGRWVEPTMAWLRPTLAVAAAVVIVVAGVLAMGQFHTVFSPASYPGTNYNSPGHHGSHPGRQKGGGGLQTSGATTPGGGRGHNPSVRPSNKGKITGSHTHEASPSPTTPSPSPSSASPTPTQTPTGTPTPTPTATPTVSPTAPSGGSISGSSGG